MLIILKKGILSFPSFIFSIFFLSCFAFAESNFSNDERASFQNSPFIVLSAFADYKFLGNVGNGRYDLEDYELNQVADNEYELIVKLKRKNGVFTYRQKIEMSVMYDKKRLWIKRKDKVFKFTPPPPTYIELTEQQRFVSATKKRSQMNVVIDELSMTLGF